jgi:hypothetical protein
MAYSVNIQGSPASQDDEEDLFEALTELFADPRYGVTTSSFSSESGGNITHNGPLPKPEPVKTPPPEKTPPAVKAPPAATSPSAATTVKP